MGMAIIKHHFLWLTGSHGSLPFCNLCTSLFVISCYTDHTGGGGQLSYSAWATIMKYDRLGGLNKQIFIFSQFWRLEV